LSVSSQPVPDAPSEDPSSVPSSGQKSGPSSGLPDSDTQTGADLLVAALLAADVEIVFGLPGVHNLALWKSLAHSPIRLVTVRHEQAAAYAADGYARTTGRVGVGLTTTGPGAANTLGAVGEAWAGRSPVVVVATDIPSTLRRPGIYRGALHETVDQAAMFVSVTKKVMHVRRAHEGGQILSAALAEALSAPRRPVYVEVPTDFLSAAVGTVPTPAAQTAQGMSTLASSGPDQADADQADLADRAGNADQADIDAALAIIDRCERPLIWVGGGAVAAGAAAEVSLLAERLVAPVITTYQARGILGRDHPCAVGVPPHMPAAGRLWDEADVVVAIGTDFDGMMTQNWRMPAPEKLVVVNIDAGDGAKNYEPDVLIRADAREATGMLAGRARQREGIEALDRRLTALREEVRDDLVADNAEAVGFLDAFDAAVPRDCVVVADMCIPGYWLAAFHPLSGPRHLAYPVGWGTLGFAFPASIGAALGGSDPVVMVSGDGGFLFACGELATVAQEKVPLTIVIVDDGGYGMLRYDQRHAGEETFGVDLLTPDFVQLARAFGLEAEEVSGLGKEFGIALDDHIRRSSPSVLVARASLDPPPTTSPRWYRAH
jgi:thiamine pyrophosphate-dependent acetolactate synthase large subunit-like protein